MRQLVTKTENGYTVSGAEYALEITCHRFAVKIENTTFAELDVRTAVPQTLDTDDGCREDSGETLPELVSAELTDSTGVFTWKSRSDLWEEKTYTLSCSRLRFVYTVTLRGHGRVDEVRYFSGDGRNGSSYEFQDGFIPCVSWYDKEDYTFKASVGCHRWSVLMVPPMFCYAFRCEGITKRLGLGLVAEKGEHNFQSFDYVPIWNGFETGFYLKTDQAGHQTVDGEWTAPAIIGYSGDNEWDVCAHYRDYYFTKGIAEVPSDEKKPRFWYGPMVCGWIEQTALGVKNGVNPTMLACEETYEELARRIHANGLHPTALIIDDKWQKHYATDEADPEKFPDLRAFVERRRAEGIRTLLWFKLWDADGWDESLCVTEDNGTKRLDPSTPEFKANLDRALYRILSSDAGCYNCDGFKLDFAFWNPIGRKVHASSGKYGVELLYDMMAYIYKKAKEIKPWALVNCSPAHPYFAHICDQARLHDYSQQNRNNREDLVMRGKCFSAAMPGVLLDTDNAGFNSRRDTMHWLLTQPYTGVPDLYSLEPTAACQFDEADIDAVRLLWEEYGARMDALHGKDILE